MRKKIFDEAVTKAKRRELKKRPRMKMHGRSLLRNGAHAGKKLASR
ncbi:MAG: hypothetical protein M1383_02605 [Patescibacteria group bacterium]|nr:hypothetical protein [Patescibacteria group bacterium]